MAADPGLAARFRRGIAHERDVVARASHIDADDVARAASFADAHRRRDTAGGSGKQRCAAKPPGLIGLRRAAVRLHDEEAGCEAVAAQLRHQPSR